MTRVLVTGSRTWTDRRAIVDALDELLAEHDALTVVHGNAIGADQMVHYWAARRRGVVTVEAHPARWNTYGKQAGMIRNAEMVDAGADICLAFIRDKSPGATHCADLAEKAGIPVKRYTP
jgi:YspA, cpYpsA-related SLOG family